MTAYSILMSVYYREAPDFLQESIESMLNQTVRSNDFVIVCDGPLTTGLDDVLERYADDFPGLFQIHRLPRNEGQGAALQKGITLCKNELVARMDSDDVSVPDRCNRQLKAFADDPGLSIVGGQIDEFETDADIPYASRRVPLTHEEITAFSKKRNPFNHMTVMFKKSAVLVAGNYQPFLLFEDYWLWVRLLQSGGRSRNLPETLVKARAGKGMVARRGGWEYAKRHIAFQRAIYQRGFVPLWQSLFNICVRVTASLIPGWARKFVYDKALRS